MSRAKQLIEDGNEFDPKEYAMQRDLDSEGFRELLHNFNEHYRDVVAKAKKSGALSGDEREMVVLKSCLVIAANDFFPGHIREFKVALRNLQKFL